MNSLRLRNSSELKWILCIILFQSFIDLIHCTKNHIFFFRTFWKDGLSKKIALEYDLSCIIGKDDISFSRKYDLTRWTENERWSFWKNTRKYDIFFRLSENMVFPKGTWSFLYYLERWFFFPENMTFLPWAESERRPFPGNTWKHDASPSEKKNRKPDT